MSTELQKICHHIIWYVLLSHIVSSITSDISKFVHVIPSFSPLGYQPTRADNRNRVFWTGKGYHVRMRRKRATKVWCHEKWPYTNWEMTLHELYGAILLFYVFNQNCLCFSICNKQIITWDFGHRPEHQTSTTCIISHRAKALGFDNGFSGWYCGR